MSSLRSFLPGVGALALLLLLAAPRPLSACAEEAAHPPGGAPRAPKNVDEWLAYVEGEYITRRMIEREIGLREEGQPEAEYDRLVNRRVLQRVMTAVMVSRARRFGLEVRPDLLDEQVAEAAKREVEQAQDREERRRAGAGKGITFERILAERGQTLDEFKRLLAREILVQQYWHILTRGIPGGREGMGKRPQFDPEPSPDEVLRLYRAHRAAFDQKAGVRLATFVAVPEKFLEDGRRSYEESVAAARAHLEAVLGLVRAGRTPQQAALERGMPKAEWSVMPAGRFVEAAESEKPKDRDSTKDVDRWVFDPARRAGDTGVFDGARGTLLGIAVLEVRGARPRSYEEVMPELITLCRNTRTERFQLQHRIESIASATVQPVEIAEALEQDLRDALAKIDEDPIRRDIRLR